jgi:hypothetical protein
MTENINRRWKLFGKIILIFCMLNLAFAFVPEIGTWAIFSGIPALILSSLILINAIRSKASKRIALLSLIVSLASIGMGYWTFTQIKFNFIIQPGWDTILIKH